MAIWQDMVTRYGFSGGYQTVQRFVGKLRGTAGPEPVGIIVTAPGEEQVDYGKGSMVRDPHSGKYRRTRLFVLINARLQPQSGPLVGFPFEFADVGRAA